MLWETGEKCLFSLLLVVRSAQYEVKSILCAAHRELGHLSQAGGARGGGSGCLNSLSFQSGRHQWVVTWVPTGVFRHPTSLENAKQDFWFLLWVPSRLFLLSLTSPFVVLYFLLCMFLCCKTGTCTFLLRGHLVLVWAKRGNPWRWAPYWWGEGALSEANHVLKFAFRWTKTLQRLAWDFRNGLRIYNKIESCTKGFNFK